MSVTTVKTAAADTKMPMPSQTRIPPAPLLNPSVPPYKSTILYTWYKKLSKGQKKEINNGNFYFNSKGELKPLHKTYYDDDEISDDYMKCYEDLTDDEKETYHDAMQTVQSLYSNAMCNNPIVYAMLVGYNCRTCDQLHCMMTTATQVHNLHNLHYSHENNTCMNPRFKSTDQLLVTFKCQHCDRTHIYSTTERLLKEQAEIMIDNAM